MKGNIYETSKGWLVWFPMGHEKDIRKRFKHFDQAERFLTGLRFKSDEGTLDGRDYRVDNPLGFSNLVDKFLHSKRLLKDVKSYEKRLRFGLSEWQGRNVKKIGFAEISGLLLDLAEKGYSSKYRQDIRNCLRCFFNWLVQCGEIKHDDLPKFPIIKSSSPYRKIITKDIQQQILHEVARITGFNPRIYIGVMFLATYINVRPGELNKIKEKDIDLDNGRILICESKTGEPKYVHLLPDDIELLRSQPRGFPELYFFRHIKGRHGAAAGQQFARNYFYRWWKKACDNLGIIGIDLYGGTRHSSAVALRQHNTPEAIKRATGHRSKTAFDRYLQIQGDELRSIYAQTRGDVIKLEKKNERNKI